MDFKDIFSVATVLITLLNTASLDETSNKNIETELIRRYNASAMKCETESGETMPEFYCSGILIRALSNKLKLDFKVKFSVATVLITLSNTVSLDEDLNKNKATELIKRYNDTTMQCVTESGEKMPAFHCSGILIRALNNTLKFPWSMKPSDKEKESFPVSFMRHDAQLKWFFLNRQSGLIIYPHLKTPAEKSTQKAVCAFPMDARTDDRNGRHGCGNSIHDNATVSYPCKEQGITTFEEWKTYFHAMNLSAHDFYKIQCGFDMTVAKAAESYEVVLRLKKYLEELGGNYTNFNNEIRLRTWDESNVKRMPIEAFYYVLGSEGGLSEAKRYQRQYKEESGGEVVPIVGIQLANSAGKEFEVVPHD